MDEIDPKLNSPNFRPKKTQKTKQYQKNLQILGEQISIAQLYLMKTIFQNKTRYLRFIKFLSFKILRQIFSNEITHICMILLVISMVINNLFSWK